MVYTFSNLPPTAVSGGKGRSLAQLYRSGYPVPDGLVITPQAFRNGELDPAAWDQVVVKLAPLRTGNGCSPFAVRSSAVSEDSDQASFAGEFESVLNVTGDKALRDAIHHVYRSGQSERVQAYSRAQSLSAQHEVAVVVQKMVSADLAGVLFTTDPVTGSHSHMIGNFVFGLGEKLLSGAATAEQFRLARPGGAYEGPEAMVDYGRSLFKLARKLEAELGSPQDIEWAVADGRLYLLQSRPITTLQGHKPATGEWNDSRRGNYLWLNSNFGEALPDVMTPATWSLIQVYEEETFPFDLPGDHPVMGNIGGRFYLNASLMVSLLKAMGFDQERIDRETEEFFGHIPDNVNVPTIPFSRWTVLKQLPRILKVRWRRHRYLARLDNFIAAMPARCERLRQQIAAVESPAELAHLWHDKIEPLLRDTYRMLQAGTSEYENRYRPLRRRLNAEVSKEDAITLLSNVSQTGQQLASLGPVAGLWQVAHGGMSREAYRQQYGHRSEQEFEISEPRPAEDPAWLDRQLANLGDVDVPGMLARQKAKQAAAWERYAVQFPKQADDVAQKIRATAAAARSREQIRSETIRLAAVVRALVLRAGDLTGLDDDAFYLSLPELMAVLVGEAETAVAHIPARRQTRERYGALPPYPPVIVGRFDPFQWAANPHRRTDIYDAHAAPSASPDANGSTITGFPGSPGVVEGMVRRLDDLAQGNQLQPGEILVTGTTNIGWTPLFPRVTAVVTDVGAPLSHAAIVARELGVPAVVGAHNATQLLHTGDRVRVNGSRGTVERLSHNGGHNETTS